MGCPLVGLIPRKCWKRVSGGEEARIWRLLCSGGVAVACHLPWVGVADGDFPRGVPGSRRIVPRRIVPPLFSFLIVLFVVGAPTLPSLSFSSCVSRRTRAVVRSGCLPQNHLLPGYGPRISYPGAVTNAATTCVQIAKLCVGYSRRSTESDLFIGITEDGRLRRIGVGHHWHGGHACPPSHRRGE